MPRPSLNRAVKLHALRWLLVAALLAAVFMAYQQPDFLVQLSNTLWACF